MFIGNSNISLFYPELTHSSGRTEIVKWLGAIKIIDFPEHPAFQYLLKTRQQSSEQLFITLGTHDIIQICRTLNHDLHEQIERYQELYLNLLKLLNTYGPTHLILFPLPLDTIKINNLSIEQRHEVVLQFNQNICDVLENNNITVIYPKEQLFTDTDLVKSCYLHDDNLHLNPQARFIYLEQIKQKCDISYTAKKSLEDFNYSDEVDVFVYLWLSDCQIPYQSRKQQIENKSVENSNYVGWLTIDNFFNSLHAQWSDSSQLNNIQLSDDDRKIMYLSRHKIHELDETIERVLPNHNHYGVVFFWQGLWCYQQGDIQQAIDLLRKSIETTLRKPFQDTKRVESYIKLWQHEILK